MKEIDIAGDEGIIYEIGYLVLPSIAEDQVSSVTSALKKLIAKEGAIEIDGEDPVMIELAYPMAKTVGASRYVVNDAYLGWVKFEVDSSKIEKIKAGVEKIEQILRFLIVKAPRKTTFRLADSIKKIEQEETEAPVLVEETVVQSEA